jgi:hypothetical protein
MHKFDVGQLVRFNPDRGERWTAPGGLYEVTKQLPHNGRKYRYGAKVYARSMSALRRKANGMRRDIEVGTTTYDSRNC